MNVYLPRTSVIDSDMSIELCVDVCEDNYSGFRVENED
jgi:hypothetical protein